MQQETVDTIEVLIRIRPFNEREKQEEAKPCFHIDSHSKNTIIFDATAKSETRYFTFDHVCNDQATQEEIFRIIGIPTATSCLQDYCNFKGYNGCIFAYGQTGAGKTYTIQGQGLDVSLNQSLNPEENEKRGILPRVVEYMFSNIESAHDTSSNTHYSVKCNFLEIYNEHIIDLLNPSTKNLQIREDLKKGVYIEGLSEEKCTNASNTLEIIQRGNRSRHIGSTNMNIESSRSHSVFTLIIEAKISKDGVTNTRRSRFSFVDLAGSERQKMASTVGDRLKEGCLINKSLMVLANVINSLVDISEGKSRFVHYRDSKLTFLLKDSIGGNSKTSIIANISPAMPSYGETLSTLKFAQRAKLIKNKVHINEDTSGTLDGLKGEIFRLRQELANMRNLINIGGIRYSDEKKLSLDFGGIPDIDPNLMQEDIPWITEEPELRGSQKSNELEVLLKQSLDILTESETHLLSELSKKDDTIERLRHSKESSDKNEINMRLVIKLLNDKVDRFRGLLQKKLLAREDCLDLIDDEQKSELKSRIIHILNESQVDFASNYPKDFHELKEEHNKLKQDYLKAIDVLSKQGEGADKMQVEEMQQIEEEFSSLREEYQQMLEAYQRVIDEMNDKNIEIGFLKETLEKHEHEKKIISEEIETLSKAFEEKTKTDYEQKLQGFVEEQEKVLDQFKEEFLLVKNERDNLQNQLNIANSQLQEIGTNHSTLLEEMDSLTSRLLNHGELESKLSLEIEEAQNKILELVSFDTQQKEEIARLSSYVAQLQENETVLKEQNESLKQQMQSALDNKEAELNEIQGQLNVLKEQLSLKTQENGDLKAQILEKEQNMNNLNELHQKALQETALKETQITNITQEYNSLEQRSQQLSEEIRQSRETCDTLNSQLSVQTTERESLKQEYEHVKEQLQGLMLEKNTLEDQNQKLNESIAQLRDEFTQNQQNLIESSQNELGNVKSQYDALVQENTQNSQEIQVLNSKIAESQQETLEKSQKLEELSQQCDSLREDLAHKEQTTLQLQSEIDNLKNQLIANDTEIAALKNENLTLNSQLSSQENQLQASQEKLNATESMKEKELADLNLRLNNLNKELRESNSQLESLHQDYDKTLLELQKTQEEYDTMKINSQNAIEALNTLKGELAEQKLTHKTLESNYNELKNEHAEQISELQTLKQEKGEVINKYEELYKAKTLEDQELMTLKQEYELSITTNQNLLSQNEELKSSETKLKDEIKRYMQTVGRLKLDYEKLNQEAGHHNESRQQFEEQITSQQSQINEKDQQLHMKTQEIETAQNEILHKNTILIEKEKELAQYQQELIEYQKNAEIHQKERNMLCTIEESLRKEIQHLSDRLQQLTSENDQTSTEFEEKLQDLQNECQNLTSNLALTQEELESLKAEKENLTQEKIQLQNQLQQQVITEAAIIKENENQLKKFQKAEKELKLQRENLQKQNSDLQEKLNDLMGALDDANKEKENAMNEKQDLQAALDSYALLETQFKEGENHAHELQETIQDNQNIINQLRTAYEESLKEATHFRSENATKEKEIARIREDQGKLIAEIQNLYVQIQDYKQLETKLRQEVAEYSQKIADIYGDQEREIKEVKDQYIRLTQEHKTILRTIASKDEQLLASKEELQLVVQEKNQLHNEIENYKVSDAKLRQENQEYYEKVARLNSDQYLLLKEIDNLNKANDSLGGHNNMGQKIRHLNKLKEENNKLKAEKNKAMEDLAKALEQKDKLQKRLDESSNTNSNSRGFFDGPRDSTSSMRFEMERKSLHRQNSGSFPDNLSKISSLIHSNLSKDDTKFVNAKSNDIESIANGVQALTMLIMEKNKVIHNRETELESVVLKNSILEKEVLLLKQKMYLSHSNSQSNNLSVNESNTTSNAAKRLQQSPSPLETRAKNRAPTPGRSIGDSQNFHKAMEFKLNNIVNNRSNSLKKPEPRLSFDENYIGNSFDSQKVKGLPIKKNLLK